MLNKLVCLLFFLLLLGCQSKSELKIGVSAPLTGLTANLGQEVIRGIELAANESRNPFQLIIEDDQCDPKEGFTVAQKLVDEASVLAILGPVCTTAILASAPYIEEHKIPEITTGMVLQKTASAGDYHFSFLPEMGHQMRAIAVYAKAQGYSKIGALAVNDDLGRESIAELKKTLEDNGLSADAEEYFDRSESDFKPFLLKLLTAKLDALYLMGYAPNMVLIIKQANELNVQLPFLTWNLYQDSAVLQGLGSLAEQAVYTYPEDPQDLPVKAAFKKKFEEAYGSEPTLYAANSYDSYKILASAIRTCSKNRECIKSQLYKIKGYEGANGFITVDERGIGQRSEVSLKSVRNGAFVTLIH